MPKRVGRKKGTPKTGGRRRGTPNRRTQHAADLLAELGCDPVEGLARIALNSKTPLDVKVSCLRTLAAYSYPKPAPMKDWSMIPVSAVMELQTRMALAMTERIRKSSLSKADAIRVCDEIADAWKNISVEI